MENNPGEKIADRLCYSVFLERPKFEYSTKIKMASSFGNIVCRKLSWLFQ